MNEIALNPIATAINHEHSLAIKHADQAIGHAKRAGELLLKAKTQLPHGEFCAWVGANVTVTQRQAQRYMAAALGKPTPIRAIAKNDTVSHLPTPSFIPDNTYWYWIASNGEGMDYVIEPAAENPGYFFVSHINVDGDTYDCTSRPILARFVEISLESFGLKDAANIVWHKRQSSGVTEALATINAPKQQAA